MADHIDEFESSSEDENPLTKKQSVAVETVDSDEFDFLDGVSELASLTSELYDVRQKLARSKNDGKYVPLKIYRSHRRNSLSVSDLQSGLWCQSQLEYRYLHPHMKTTKQWEKQAKEGNEIKKTTPVMAKGSDLHQKKELEVHERVAVPTVTKEDKWAMNLLNTYQQLSIIKNGRIEREISVFGDPFKTGILYTGIIDQVEYNKETMELTVMDYKTRRTPSLPQKAQKMGHDFQVMMYKLLLDGFTRQTADKSLLVEHLQLDLTRTLTLGVMDYILSLGLTHLFCPSPSGSLKFGDAVDTLGQLIAGLDLPPVSKLFMQYEYQVDGTVIGVESVEFNKDWAKEVLETQVKFWTGEEYPGGPDIEELWKCNSCQFKEVCVWRKQKVLEKSPASKIRI